MMRLLLWLVVFELPLCGQFFRDEICLDTTILNLSATISAAQYRWSFQGTDYFGPDISLKFHQATDAMLLLEVTDEYGCFSNQTAKIIIEDCWAIYAPTAFTPNGDGINDLFMPVGTGIEIEQLLIYNRWGKCIYAGNTPWNGIYMNDVVQNDVYVWKVFFLILGKKKMSETGKVILSR